MRKPLTEKVGINATLMTFEQLLVLIVSECGEFAVEEFLSSRYEFPCFREDKSE